MAGEIIKVYNSYTNALAGGATGQITVGTVNSNGGTVYNGNETVPYFIFKEYWYRIETNDLVAGVYIDWDDGEDNSKEKANVSIIKNEKPSFFGITSHIYTQSKKFYPLLRVKSVEGFLSKWYTSHAGDGSSALNTFSGLDDSIKTTATGGQVYDSGQNSFSVVSVEQNDDATAYARIPVFEPANVPPIGVLKTDRKRVFSNIDNDNIYMNGRLLNGQGTFGTLPYTDTVVAYCSNPARTGIQVKVTYQEGIVGGAKAVASIQIVAKGGPGTSGGQFYNRDLDDAAIFIKTMDAHYCCFWNADSRQADGTAIPNFNPDVHTPVIAVPSGGNGNTGVVTIVQVVTSMVNALNAVKFPASTGRTEFTATGTNDGDVEQITITNLREGNPAAGAWITLQNCTLGAWPFELAGGYGASGVRTNGTGEGAGVSPSGGNIKQKTLTTIDDKSQTSAKIESVENILKAELVNNLEGTDGYKGTSSTTKLYPGERVYLLSSIGVANNYNLPTLTGRNLDTNIHNTVCHVSLGNPIVTLGDSGGHAMVDASESKIRCANKSVAYYYFDDNKLISGDNVESDGGTNNSHMSLQNFQEADTTDASWGITDKLVDGITQKTTISARELRYSNEWFREHTDSNYRFYPQKRLVRCQVDDDHTQVSDDSFSRSPIEHWDYSGYITASSADNSKTGAELPSEVSKYNYGAFLFTNKAQARAPNWSDLKEINRSGREHIFHCAPTSLNVNGTPYNNQLLASTSFDTHNDFSAANEHYEPDNRSAAMAVGSGSSGPDNVEIGPRNALFMAKKEKYDRLFVRVSHDLLQAGTLEVNDIANNPTPGTTACMPKVRLQILYPAKKTSAIGSSEDKVIWKALSFIDRTSLKDKDDSSLYKSGDITFIPPSDWVKTSHSTMNPTAATDTNIIYPFEDNFFEDGDGATGINDVWTKDSYALIFLITVIYQGAEAAKNCFGVTSILPYNNSHSQVIEVVDPTHVSLNNYGIAQSVSFVRKGKYQEIKDRSGISMLRRVGAQGGSIKLGGIDLKSDTQTTRAKFDEFQKDAVPVYYDITHKDSSITRLFGTMTEMSEDHPTGEITPKFACTMIVTHMLEIDSSGNITGNGYKPLGGDTIDVSQYLSAA